MAFDYTQGDRWDAPVNVARCRASVAYGGRNPRFHQCHRKPVGGSKYCKQHSPEAAQARRDASDRRYKEQWQQHEKNREIGAVTLLRELGYTVIAPKEPPHAE